jgi:uncharacterized spore protein YtfJ
VEHQETIGQGESRNQFVERIAESVGSHASVRAVFGDPVEREGVTVIPVARMRYGFGGGLGTKQRKNKQDADARRSQEGSGGGGGARIAPAGYIALSKDGAQFREIRDPYAEQGLVIATWLGAGLGAWLVLRGMRGLIAPRRR